MQNEYYNPNNVTADNFNETMYGYFKRVLKEAGSDLKDNDFDEKQIQAIKTVFKTCLRYSVDMMTMEEARKYFNKH